MEKPHANLRRALCETRKDDIAIIKPIRLLMLVERLVATARNGFPSKVLQTRVNMLSLSV